MSQENVEIVRDWIALANAGDVPAILQLLDPDIECFPAEDEPEAEAFRGREAYARRANDALEAFDEHRIQALEYIDLGDYVAVVARIHARGRTSRVPVSDDEVWLIRFRDGKVVEYRECTTRERALKIAGVAEQAMSQENVEVVSQIYEAINADRIHSAFPLLTKDFEWVNPPYAIEPGMRSGHTGFADAIANLREAFPALEYSLDSMREHGDQVLTIVTFRGGRREGGETTWPRYHVWTLRDGKVSRFRWFSHQSEALEAVGASEQEAQAES